MFRPRGLKRLPEAIAFYLEDALARGESPRTVEGKACYLNKFALWSATQKVNRLSNIDLNLLEAYRRYLYRYRQPYSDKPLDKSTIRNRLTCVKVFIDRLHYHEVITGNPLSRFELPPAKRRLPKDVLTAEEAEHVLSSSLYQGVWGIRDRTVLEVFYATGIRRMELANLIIPDLDSRQNLLRITKGKGDKDRYVPIARRACDWIKIYLNSDRQKLAHLGSGNSLFLSNNGEKMQPYQLTGLATKALRRSGIKKRGGCNIFRHSTATLMLQNGADIRIIQEMLGHADISTTQIYTQVSPLLLQEVYSKTHPAAMNK